MNRQALHCLLLVCCLQIVPADLSSAAPRVPLPLPSDALVYFGWDTPYFLVPLNAPAINEEKAIRLESWSGYSLLRDSASSTDPVAIPVFDPSGRTNITSAQGAIRFWFSPNWTTADKGGDGKGPGHFARLIELVNLDTVSSEVRWSLYVDETGSSLYFSGLGPVGATDFFKASVHFNAGEWHMLTLGYSTTNSALWIDNQLVATGAGPAAPPGWQQTSLGLIVGSDITTANTAEGQFEELATFRRSPDSKWDAYMLDQFYFNISRQMVFLGPVGTREEERAKQQALTEFMQANGMLALEAGLDEGGGMAMMSSSYSSNELWLEITGVTNGLVYLIVHTTEPDVPYEILSKSTLTNSAWTSEGLIIGADASDFTATVIPVLDRTNSLFFWARSWADSDGGGIPDWWRLEYFQTNNVDPYGDPDGDGWVNLREFENGTNPTQFDPPPPPNGVFVTADWIGTNFLVNWETGGGAVTEYEITDYSGNELDSVNSSTFTATVQPGADFLMDPRSYDPPYYRIRARFANGASSITAPVPVLSTVTPDVRIVRGPAGKAYIALLNTPPGLSAIRVVWYEFDTAHSFDTSITNFTNGLAAIPDGVMVQNTYEYLYIQGVRADGALGAFTESSIYVAEEWSEWPGQFQFVDGRTHLKENLKFLLRSATVSVPFSYSTTNRCCGGSDLSHDFASTNYEYYGTRFFRPGIGYSVLQEARPIHDNFMFRNFAHSSGDFSNTTFRTGAIWDIAAGGVRTIGNQFTGVAKYRYTGSGYESTLPVSYSNDSFPWILYGDVQDSGPLFDAVAAAEVGVSFNTTSTRLLATGVRNLFGLRLLSLRAGPSALALAGSTFVRTNHPYFPNFESPQLQTVDYYFVSQSGYINDVSAVPPVLPGSPEFTITNTSPLLVASVGEPLTIAGWAKQSILNGYSNKFAYLEQYFDTAYRIGTNGIATTNKTGVLSPYGEFLPTEPGPTALVTMPDIETGVRGTGIVHVISLNVDGNHDGTMDFSFNGPDTGSASKPFRFWVNDDDDSGEDSGNDTPSQRPGQADAFDFLPGNVTDYRGWFTYRIHGSRDLVDYFPVALNIGTVVQALPPGQNVAYILKQADTAVNIAYTDLQANDCNRYLTDTNVAASTVTNRAIVVSAQGTVLDTNFIQKIAEHGHGIILVEGRTNTTSPLVLEIWQGTGFNPSNPGEWNGTNLLARAELQLSLSGVEDMFRQKNLIRVVWTNSVEGLPDRLTDASVPNELENNGKNFVFLHGYNVNANQARGTFAETFKRLYWSGSRAKFYGVTWKGYESQKLGAVTPDYHTNVVNAFLTAPKLRDFLATLSGENILAAHSLGNMAVLSALSDWDAPISNFFMIDAAVAVEALQGDAAQNTNMIHPGWFPYANRVYASSWYNLFGSGDHRRELTWIDRLSNLRNADVYNFYSSGEEVLREHRGVPPFDLVTAAAQQLYDYFKNNAPFGTFAWAWQEKTKGRTAQPGVLGSTHGGWKFNPAYIDQTNFTLMSTNQANALPDSQLRTNAFFTFGSDSNTNLDAALLGANGSQYAQDNRNRILADAIPALTLAIGANPVDRLSPQGQPSRNLDMNLLYQNGWPLNRPISGSEAFKWYHSDFKNVAYTYTHPLFDAFVTLGNLQ
jgi:hypothetical protein